MRSAKTDDAQVEIDGGYVRGQPKQRKVAVVSGKSILAFKRDQEGKQELSGRCFAWVQTYDEKPKHRLFELLKRQGMQPNQQVNFPSDGSEDVRNLQLSLNPQAEHPLDRFRLTMGLTVLSQTAKGLPERLGEEEDKYELRTGVLNDLERIRRYLWHGNVFQALNELQSLEIALDAAFESKSEHPQELFKGVEELHTPTSSATRSSYRTAGSAREQAHGEENNRWNGASGEHISSCR
jgi:hypothetical protein